MTFADLSQQLLPVTVLIHPYSADEIRRFGYATLLEDEQLLVRLVENVISAQTVSSGDEALLGLAEGDAPACVKTTIESIDAGVKLHLRLNEPQELEQKRQQPRLPVKLPLKIKYQEDSSDAHWAWTLNLSLGGLLIEGALPCEAEQELMLEIALPLEDGGHTLELQAQVVRAQEHAENGYQIAVAFTEPDTQQQQLLQAYYQARRNHVDHLRQRVKRTLFPQTNDQQ